MNQKIYKCVITFDPPLDEISEEVHSFVDIEVHGTEETIKWFISKLREDGLRGRIMSMSDVETLI